MGELHVGDGPHSLEVRVSTKLEIHGLGRARHQTLCVTLDAEIVRCDRVIPQIKTGILHTQVSDARLGVNDHLKILDGQIQAGESRLQIGD